MKSYTDISQSKKLAEILPIESADMYYSELENDSFPQLIRVHLTNENWKQLYENMPSNKSKDSAFKPSKIDIKNYGEKNVFEKEKTEFLKKKKRRYKSKKEDSSLPASMKGLISKYADVMVNVGASDLTKYAEYKKYNKNQKKKGK